MKKMPKIIYNIKLFLFIIHFYFVFISLHNILDTKIYGLIFVILYIIYILTNIIQIISQKKRYQNDIIYNLMQIGMLSYILVIAIKTYTMGIYVTNITYEYFKNNYLILSLLIAFILIYSLLEFKKSSK